MEFEIKTITPSEKIDIIIIIGLALLIFECILLKDYYPIVVLVAILCYVVFSFIKYKSSKPLLIDTKAIQTSHSASIKWDEITKVTFTVSFGRNYRDTIIFIYTNNQTYKIHTKDYYKSKEIRDLLEKICIEKSITRVVEDRGLY
jgi:hypothetical protein